MNLEEFEKGLAGSDAAARAAAMTDADKAALANTAMESAPADIVPLSAWTSRRKWTTSAAAVVVVGLAATSMNGAMVADRGPRLELTAGGNSALAGDQALGGLESKKSMYGGWLAGYNFIADGTFSDEAQVGTAYKMVGWTDFEARFNQVGASFGMNKATFDKANNLWAAEDSDNKDIFLNAWLDESGFGGFQYIDNKILGYDCTVISSETGAEDCTIEPTKNLPTRAAAETKFRSLLAAWNVSLDDLKFETYIDQYAVTIIATKYVEGAASPLTWSVTFAEDARIQYANGTMGDLVALGEYDLISPADAIKRANEISVKQQAAWAETETDMASYTKGVLAVPASDGGPTSDPSDGTENPEPIEEPYLTRGSYEPVDMYITDIKRGMQMAWLADGTQLWVPTYEFFGHEKGGNTMEWPVGSTIAIVASQFDLDAYTKGLGGNVRAM